MSDSSDRKSFLKKLKDAYLSRNYFLPKLFICWFICCALSFLLGLYFYYVKGLPSQGLLATTPPEQVKGLVAFKYTGELIMRASLNALIAGFLATITAHVAFHNMDRNEKKKIAREEYQSYSVLLITLQNWKNRLLGIDGNFPRLRKLPIYARGLAIPYILYKDNHSSLQLSSLSFLSRFVALDKDNNCASDDRCLNVLELAQMEVQFNHLILMIHRRNELHQETFGDLLNEGYVGAGECIISDSSMRGSVSFAEFTNFLNLSEQILEISGELIIELDEVISGLNENRSRLLDKEIVKEKGGTTKIHSQELNKEDYEYTPLSPDQRALLYGADYPIKTFDYSEMKGASYLRRYTAQL